MLKILWENLDLYVSLPYDQMVKYTAALKIGTAETAIMKRFTRNNLKHPTYKALQELGKAVKTIFLCEYLMSEELRIEINQGLKKEWLNKMQAEDYRALSPLIYQHVNPYGNFELNMDERIKIQV